jgi:hypothetical protein
VTNTIKKIWKTHVFLALFPGVLMILTTPSPARADDVTVYDVVFTQTAGPTATNLQPQFDVDNTTPSLSSFGLVWSGGPGADNIAAAFGIGDSALTAGWAGIGALVPACASSNPTQQVVNVMEGCTGSDADWSVTLSQVSSGNSTLTFSLFTAGTSFQADAPLISPIDNRGAPIVESGYLTITPEGIAAPEPAGLSLLALGLAALFFVRRKMKPPTEAA